jgi:hypothetical protein
MAIPQGWVAAVVSAGVVFYAARPAVRRPYKGLTRPVGPFALSGRVRVTCGSRWECDQIGEAQQLRSGEEAVVMSEQGNGWTGRHQLDS